MEIPNMADFAKLRRVEVAAELASRVDRLRELLIGAYNAVVAADAIARQSPSLVDVDWVDREHHLGSLPDPGPWPADVRAGVGELARELRHVEEFPLGRAAEAAYALHGALESLQADLEQRLLLELARQGGDSGHGC